MTRWRSIFILFLFSSFSGRAQELFPLSEPASTLPKNTVGIRMFSETYKEVKQWRNMSYLRMMYGLTPRLSVYLSAIASNHHGEKMPLEFPFHNTPERGKFYPYKLNGGHIYAKYRFISIDGANKHFRIAAFAEAAYVKTTHHETEPDLDGGDNSGAGFGLIATALKKNLAASLTAGAVIPFKYSGYAPDPIKTLPDIPVRVQYGNALEYQLSIGYRLLPFQYKNYRQGNLNLYLNLSGKAFGAARVDMFYGQPNEYYLHNEQYPPALQAGWFVDISPGIQYIIQSNLRVDFSVTFHGSGFSYARLYPVYSIGLQRYFYF